MKVKCLPQKHDTMSLARLLDPETCCSREATAAAFVMQCFYVPEISKDTDSFPFLCRFAVKIKA